MTGLGIFIIVTSVVLNAFLLLVNQYRKDQLQKESRQVYKLEKELKVSKEDLKESNEQVEILQALDNALTKEAAHKLAILGKAYDKEKGQGEARELLQKDHSRRVNPYKTETQNYSIDFKKMGFNMLDEMDCKPEPRVSPSAKWGLGSTIGGSSDRKSTKSRPTTPARSGRGYSPSYDPTPFTPPSYTYDDDSSRSSSHSSSSSSYDSGSSSDSGGGGFD